MIITFMVLQFIWLHIYLSRKILEKPANDTVARQYIREYGENSCTTVGSIVLTDTLSNKRVYGVDRATIYFKPISENIIDSLIEEGQVFYCAGGLMIEHPLIREFIIKIDGTEESVMGLSVELLKSLLIRIRE